jgi:hypothetical protein
MICSVVLKTRTSGTIKQSIIAPLHVLITLIAFIISVHFIADV